MTIPLEQRLQRAAEITRAAVAGGECVSAVVGAASARETLLLEAFSPADGSETTRADSIYLLASITKTFIGTAIMQLAEQRRLLVTDQAARYVPEFASRGKERVTIAQLLAHTSGLSDTPYLETWQRRGSQRELIEASLGAWLEFPPGDRYQYCSASYYVLGELITRLSGEAYPDYIRTHICEPLGMRDTGFDFVDERAARMLPVHTWEPEGMVSGEGALAYFRSTAFAGGGLWSSAPDLLRYGQAQLNALQGRQPALCGASATRLMTRRHAQSVNPIDGRPGWAGLGWDLDDGSGTCLGRGSGFGHESATCSYLWIEPELDLVFVFLTNMWAWPRRASQLALNAVLTG